MTDGFESTPADGGATDQAKEKAHEAVDQAKDKAQEAAGHAKNRLATEVDGRSTALAGTYRHPLDDVRVVGPDEGAVAVDRGGAGPHVADLEHDRAVGKGQSHEIGQRRSFLGVPSNDELAHVPDATTRGDLPSGTGKAVARCCRAKLPTSSVAGP